MKKLLISLALLVPSAALSAQTSSLDGTWKNSSNLLVFNASKEYTFSGGNSGTVHYVNVFGTHMTESGDKTDKSFVSDVQGTYTLEGSVLTIKYDKSTLDVSCRKVVNGADAAWDNEETAKTIEDTKAGFKDVEVYENVKLKGKALKMSMINAKGRTCRYKFKKQ